MMVKMLASEGLEAKPGGAVCEMTVMVANIGGFTGRSERPAEQIVPVRGAYFDTMSREIHGAQGTVGKFIGDAVTAFWGAPSPDQDHALPACRAALASQRAIRLSGLADDRGDRPRVRIGINTGNMLVGNIGSDVRLNHTVIGDSVHVASRLESANKQYGTDIIIGGETRAAAGNRILVRELDRLAVHGRKEGVRIYELLGMADQVKTEPNWVVLYHTGLAAYRGRRFADALGFFQMLLVVREGDRAAQLMIERCRQFLEAPPAADWEATAAMDTK
jgi:adenylate cyclase